MLVSSQPAKLQVRSSGATFSEIDIAPAFIVWFLASEHVEQLSSVKWGHCSSRIHGWCAGLRFLKQGGVELS
jgi:hypothetical protein